jgi:hypothetical protein
LIEAAKERRERKDADTLIEAESEHGIKGVFLSAGGDVL